jgi:D-3-phosphoglycerate dehydrogenase / 2-oxoglutarate reductase
LGLERVSLRALFERSDAVVFQCSLGPETHHLLNDESLAWLREGALVINTSRGRVIDEVALMRGLERGHIAGAALDVFEKEPLAVDHPLRGFPNVIFGAHNASNTYEAVQRTNERAIENVLLGLGLGA